MAAANPFTTGTPFTFTFKPAAATQEEKKDDEDDEHGGQDDAHHLEEESKAEFTPVVKLNVRVVLLFLVIVTEPFSFLFLFFPVSQSGCRKSRDHGRGRGGPSQATRKTFPLR